MKRKLAVAAASAVALPFALGGGAAQAAHCVSPDGTSPGFSYFGTVHVKQDGHDNEGQGRPHAGTPGASNCRETAGSPANR